MAIIALTREGVQAAGRRGTDLDPAYLFCYDNDSGENPAAHYGVPYSKDWPVK